MKKKILSKSKPLKFPKRYIEHFKMLSIKLVNISCKNLIQTYFTEYLNK